MPHTEAVLTLIEDTDPHRRMQAHLTLGERALDRQDTDTALVHFREARDLDPTDERPRTALLELEGAARRPGRVTFWRWLMRRKGAEA